MSLYIKDQLARSCISFLTWVSEIGHTYSQSTDGVILEGAARNVARDDP